MAALARPARLPARRPLRMCRWSSSQETSRTWRSRFSIAQWPRLRAGSSSGPARSGPGEDKAEDGLDGGFPGADDLPLAPDAEGLAASRQGGQFVREAVQGDGAAAPGLDPPAALLRSLELHRRIPVQQPDVLEQGWPVVLDRHGAVRPQFRDQVRRLGAAAQRVQGHGGRRRGFRAAAGVRPGSRRRRCRMPSARASARCHGPPRRSAPAPGSAPPSAPRPPCRPGPAPRPAPGATPPSAAAPGSGPPGSAIIPRTPASLPARAMARTVASWWRTPRDLRNSGTSRRNSHRLRSRSAFGGSASPQPQPSGSSSSPSAFAAPGRSGRARTFFGRPCSRPLPASRPKPRVLAFRTVPSLARAGRSKSGHFHLLLTRDR